MKTNHSKGNWNIGKVAGTVIADNVKNNLPKELRKDEKEYYGGYLVAESIRRKDDAMLIAAAPDLLEALLNIENDDNSIPKPIWEMRNNAIRKATFKDESHD